MTLQSRPNLCLDLRCYPPFALGSNVCKIDVEPAPIIGMEASVNQPKIPHGSLIKQGYLHESFRIKPTLQSRI